ncbi:MAG: hypothetical protein MUF45_07250 [Spirosomaceae bacterium]|jgi:hypothetical protein|nr:hypothetical protein [Spirosomataceae bacterium]
MKKITFWSMLFICSKISAQQWLGISNSNYGGTNTLYVNPANVADSRYKFVLNLVGSNVSVVNNYASWKAPYSITRLFTGRVQTQYLAPSGKAIWREEYAGLNNVKKASAFSNAELRGPSVIYTNDKLKFAIALTSRVRLLTNLNNASTDVGLLIIQGTKAPILSGTTRTDNQFNLNLNYYNETAFTFGVVLKETDQDFIKVGFTAKRISTPLNINGEGRDIDFRITPISSKNQRITLLEAVGNYGVASQNMTLRSAWFSENAINLNGVGTGYGGDIGLVYEYRPEYIKYYKRHKGKTVAEPTENKYKYRASVALLDVGVVNFSDPTLVSQVDVQKTNVNIEPGTFNKIKTTDMLLNSMNTVFQPTVINRSFQSWLPMALSASFDYQYSDKIYLNVSAIQSLRNPKSLGMFQNSMISFTPRLETKWYDISLPITLQNGYKNLTFGLAARAGGFFLGTDNIAGLINLGNPKGLDFYGGLFVPIFRKLPDQSNECYTDNNGKRPKNWLSSNRIKKNWRKLR